MTERVWRESFRVRSYEADPGGRASIQTLCNYLQEAASNHAADLGVSIEQLTEEKLIWMLARLRVEVEAYPKWRDEVTVETWPSGSDRLYATRDFLVHGTDGDLLARGTSAWLLVDAERRRPIRLPELITGIELPQRERALEDLPAKLPDPPEAATEMRLHTRYSDLDLIGHVNNVLYVDWIVESVPADTLRSHAVRTIELQFRAEAHFGDDVTVRTGCETSGSGSARASYRPPLDGSAPSDAARNSGEDEVFIHLISSQDRELARGRTLWRRK